MATSYDLPLDIIPTSKCSGSYAMIRTSTSYTGPTFNIRRSSDNATSDFYSNAFGQIGTALDGTGTSLQSWLGTATPYITTWYDQSGKGNHATQTNTSYQPTIDLINNQVDFTSGSSFFNLPSGTAPNKLLEGIYQTAGNTYISINSSARTTLIAANANMNTLNSLFDATIFATVVMNGDNVVGDRNAPYITGSRTSINASNEFNMTYGFYFSPENITKCVVLTFRLYNNAIDVYQSNAFYYAGNVTSSGGSYTTNPNMGSSGYGVTNISVQLTYSSLVKYQTAFNTYLSTSSSARTAFVANANASVLNSIFDSAIYASVIMNGGNISGGNQNASYLSGSRTNIISNEFSITYGFYDGASFTKCAMLTFRLFNNAIDVYQSNAYYFTGNVTTDISSNRIYNPNIGPSGYGVTNLLIYLQYLSVDTTIRTPLISEPASLEHIYDAVLTANVAMNGAWIGSWTTAKYMSNSRTPIVDNQFSVVYAIAGGGYAKCATITFRLFNNAIDMYQSSAFFYKAEVNDYSQTAYIPRFVDDNNTPVGIGSSGYGIVYFSIKSNPSAYTVIVKHGDINNSTGCWLGSGGSGAIANSTNNFSRTSTGYINSWYQNDYTGNNVYNSGNVVTYAHDGIYSYLFVNEAPQGISPVRSGWGGVKGNEYIGRDNNSANYFNGKMSFLYIFKSFLTANERSIVERGMYTFNTSTPFKFSQLRDVCGLNTTMAISQARNVLGIANNQQVALSSFSNFSLRNGLFMRLYYGMNFNNNPNFFNNNTPSVTGVTTNLRNTYSATGGFINPNRSDIVIGPISEKQFYSVEWTGVFYAPVSGTYTFYLASDDSSYLWLGDNALSGYTVSNCLVNAAYVLDATGGSEVSGSISLVAGQYYPIRIQFGDFGGGEFMKFRFSLPNGISVYEGTGYFYCQAYPSYTYTNSVPNVYNSNLSMHYTFETSTLNGTTLLNNATNSYDSTLYGGANISSSSYKVGSSSLSLSAASSQYVQLPSFTPSTNGLTFSFWYKSNGSGTWGQIFAFGNGAADYNILCSSNGDVTNALTFAVYNGSTRTFFNLTDINYNDNTWRHVVWTLTYPLYYSSSDNLYSSWNIYINGVLKTTTSNRYPSTTVTRTLCYLGKSHWANEAYFNGNIDDFRVYNRIFSSDEIANLYINNVNNYTTTVSNTISNTNLSAYFPFEFSDISGTKITYSAYTLLYEATRINGATVSTSDYAAGGSSLSLNKDLSQYVQIPSFTPTTNGLTFSFWYRSNASGSWGRIFDFGNGANVDNILCSITAGTTNQLSCSVAYLVNSSYVQKNIYLSDINYNDNVWRHVVWTLTPPIGNDASIASTWNVYINGVIKSTSTNYYPDPAITRTLCYLGKSNWADGYYNGYIDDFRIYNRVLSSTEVSNIYLNTQSSMSLVSNNNLSIHFPFETLDQNGTSIVYNSNILSYDATMYNGATVSSADYKVGISSLYLNKDLSQYMQLPFFTPTKNGLTFSFWYKSNGSGSNARVFDFGNGQENNNILCGINAYGANQLAFYCSNGTAASTALIFSDITSYNDNVWRHVAWTLTYASAGSATSVWNIYINGVYKGTTTNYYPYTTISRTLCYIGKSNWAGEGYYNGYIDDFRIYNRVLSASEINNIYNSQLFINSVSNNQLIMYYPFETSDKSGTTLANNANPNNILFDATLYGGATVSTGDYKVGLSLSSLSLSAASSQYVQTANFTSTTNGLTFSFWYKSNGSGTNVRVFDFGNGEEKNNILCVINAYGANQLALYCSNETSSTTPFVLSDITSYNDNVWRHITWTLTYAPTGSQTSTWKVYVNGVFKKIFVGYYPLTTVTRTLCYIGKTHWSGTGYFNGYIDDFRVYNRVLSAAEIKNVYSYKNNTIYTYAIKNGAQTITTQIQGTTPQNPATSGYAMYLSNPWLPNNYYWIKSASMKNAVQMYVDIKNGGFDYYHVNEGMSVNDITLPHSGTQLGLELMVPRSQTHWKSIYDYIYNVLGSNYTTYLRTINIYKTASFGNYSGYAMFDQRYGNSGSTIGSYNGAPDWRTKDNGLWYIKDIPFSEPNGDYFANAFIGTYGDVDYTYGISYMTGYYSPGFNDANAVYYTGSNYIVSTNYAGSTVSTLYTYLDGSTAERAAPSALYIKNQTGTNDDGVYWINLPTVGPTQVYCIMNSAVDGGGWMMAMKATTGTTFQFSSSHWTTVTTLNPSDNTRNNADAKFHTMNYFQCKDMLALWPDIPYNYGGGTGGNLSLPTYNNWSWIKNNYNSGVRQTLINYFSTASNFSFGTAKGVERGTAFSSQGGNMFYGVNFTLNQNGAYRHVRWGFGWNNESDWVSNDSTGGIGMNNPAYSAGDYAGYQDQTGINRSARVEMYVR